MKAKDARGASSIRTPLCRSCTHASYIRGASLCDVILYCKRFDREMKFEAYECKEYYDGKAKSLYAMEEIAWRLNVDRRGRPVGFTPPEEDEESESSI
jgi:hypothetical protein